MTPLYLPCPPDHFAAARGTEGNDIAKLDATNRKVWLNHHGRCSVQQFGNLAQARRKYEQIKKEIK